MKSLVYNTESPNRVGVENIYFENQKTCEQVQIIDYFNDPQNGQLIISLRSHLFAENQQKIYLRENKLIIIVSELVRTYKSDSTYVSDWQTYGQQAYVRMRNISLFLPGDNFYLLRHYFVPEKLILNIVIGKLIDN